MRWLMCLLLGLAVLAPNVGARAQEPARVDVQLILAIDSSTSVDMDEFYLQLEGYAAAFRHPDLLKAIQSGPQKAIAVTLFEWSDPDQQVVNFPWRVLRDESDLTAFAEELAVAPRLVIGGQTAIGNAIDYAMALFLASGVEGGRRVIDLSGDGASNRGRDVRVARDNAVFLGVTINGVAILNEEPDLATYYQRFVVGGVGAFALPAKDYRDFQDVIVKKLVREITTIAAAPSRPD